MEFTSALGARSAVELQQAMAEAVRDLATDAAKVSFVLAYLGPDRRGAPTGGDGGEQTAVLAEVPGAAQNGSCHERFTAVGGTTWPHCLRTWGV